MIGETQLHFISSIVILLAAAVPIYLTTKVSGELKRLTALLSIFIFIHAIYQIASFYDLKVLADNVFEPLSAAVLIYFGLNYYGQARTKKDTSIKNMVVAWSPATLVLVMNGFTILLLLVAMSLFVWLAATHSKKIRSFQFQLSMFILIWISGELVSMLQNRGIAVITSLPYIGEEIHVVSMIFFTGMLWLRYYYSERSGKKMVEGLDAKYV